MLFDILSNIIYLYYDSSEEGRIKTGVKRISMKSFAIAITAAFLISTMVIPAFASSQKKTITVTMGGIKIYIDGNIQVPKDVNGNTVEPIIYNGTTYLPVRALTGMLTDKEVAWDQEKQSVYIGTQPTAESTPIDQLEPYEAYQAAIYTGDHQWGKFRILDKTITTFNCLDSRDPGYLTYLLKSNYSAINGKFAIEYSEISSTDKATLSFYSVDSHGNETMLKSYELKAGDKTVDVNVNITGVDILKIECSTSVGKFHNITLTGLK
jgi:hypothetical protein